MTHPAGAAFDSGDPDGRVGAGKIVLQRGAVVAHHNTDGFVVFLDEREGGIGLLRGGALDGEVSTQLRD